MEGHRIGKWHSLVSIELPPKRRLVEAAIDVYGAFRVETPHVSVSRPFTLSEHEIDGFVHRLRRGLLACEPLIVCVLERAVRLESNDRVFWALQVAPTPPLKRVVAAVDDALLAYRKTPYHVPPVFHVTVAVEGEDATNITHMLDDDDDDDLTFHVDSVVCKCAHRRFDLPLGPH